MQQPRGLDRLQAVLNPYRPWARLKSKSSLDLASFRGKTRYGQGTFKAANGQNASAGAGSDIRTVRTV